jgi:hypothetical protein
VQVENAKAQAANYPFCTIEPNVGVVAVPDPRLDVLSQLSHSQRVVPTSVEFVDIAGLVKGASQGEVFFLLSCFSLLQNLSTQMHIPSVSSFLHLCFFLLQIDFNGDILLLLHDGNLPLLCNAKTNAVSPSERPILQLSRICSCAVSMEKFRAADLMICVLCQGLNLHSRQRY